jgi:Calcineurin-like phosphoesterase
VRILVLLLGCFDTSYHLVLPDDIHAESDAAPDGWQNAGFDDGAWMRTRSRQGAYARYGFAVGADVSAIVELDLSLQGDGEAYINGVPITGTLAVGPGLLRPAGNVLAIHGHGAPTLAAKTGAGPTTPHLVRGPYLLTPTAGGATVVWETNCDTPSSLVVDGRSLDGGGGRRHVAVVGGLEPSRAYGYHVEVGGQRSPDASLMTAARPGEPVRFAVFGDNRTNGDTHRRLVSALVGEAPDFIVNTGDMVGESSDIEWKMFFDIEYPLLVNTPLVAAIGNHEADYGDDDQYARLLPAVGASFGGRVYSIDYGDVHLAMLDSNHELDDQRGWLDADLTAAEGRGARHLFVVLHWGPWCGVNKVGHGGNDEAADAIVPVARKHGVAALFSGHNHVYERGADGNLRYVVTGGGGAPLDTPGLALQTQMTRAVNSYVIVDVVGGQVHLTAKDEAGAPFDEAAWTVTR